jgi:hypothetical protein
VLVNKWRWGSRGIALLILSLDTSWGWVVTLRPNALPSGKKPRYALYRWLGGALNRSGRIWKEISCFQWDSIPGTSSSWPVAVPAPINVLYGDITQSLTVVKATPPPPQVYQFSAWPFYRNWAVLFRMGIQQKYLPIHVECAGIMVDFPYDSNQSQFLSFFGGFK